MCSKPHAVAKAAHQLFLEANLGDPGLFPGTVKLEREAIRYLTELLNGKNAVGFIVTGGTEANLLALLAARNKAKTNNPEVVLPQSAHFSFNKICSMLCIKPVYAKLGNTFQVEPLNVEECINENTIAIVGTAGTAELGAIDPIDKLSEIALEHEIYLHVDAALGGLILPFMENAPPFDFRVRGVNSITVDPHKIGMSIIPAGGILFRDDTYLEHIKTETPYLTEGTQYTFVGTRSGASAAATWAVFETLGREGYANIVKRCLSLTNLLASQLKKRGLTLVMEPALNIVAFRAKDAKYLAAILRQRGWFVSYVPRFNCIRIIVMPHTKKKHIMAFLKELDNINATCNCSLYL